MQLAIVKDGKVINLVKPPADWPNTDWRPAGDYDELVESDTARIGDDYDGASFTTPVVLPTVAEARDAKVADINAERERRIDAGIVWDTHTVDSDDRSRANLAGVIQAVDAGVVTLPAGYTWRMADDTEVEVTIDDLKAIAAILFDHVDTQYRWSWSKKAEVEAILADDTLTDTEKVERIQTVSW